MRPAVGGRNPETTANSVVLPAPFGPIRAVMRPASAVNEALSTASSPPKRFDTLSTRRSSAMAAPRCHVVHAAEQVADAVRETCDAARRERDDEHQHAAVNDEVEAGRVAGEKLGRL